MTKNSDKQERADSAKAVESETVERTDNDGNPVDENGAPLTQEQEAQQAQGENTQPDFEATSGLTPEAEQANTTRPQAEEESTD